MVDSTSILEIGTTATGTTSPAKGKIYRASIYSTIGGTTPVVDFNPDRDGSDAATSFASSATGETWTINSSGALKAQIVGRASLLFDGTADYLKTNAFTLNQPETVYIVFKQVSWTLNDTFFSGEAATSTNLFQSATTPRVRIYGGITGTENANLAVGSYGVLAAVFNATSSLTQINLTSPVTASAGTNNGGGITLGANGDGTSPANVQVLEVLPFSTPHDATQRARVAHYLIGRYGVS